MKKKKNIKKYILLIIASIIITFTLLINLTVYNASFEQYIYSLLKSEGTGQPIPLYKVLLAVIIFIITSFVLIFPTININKKITININDKKELQLYPIKKIKKYSNIVLALSIIFAGFGFGLFQYLTNRLQETDLFKKYYVNPENVEITFPEDKKNLIYIILESTETTNFSKENGGIYETSIIPNLERIALENTNFSNTNLLGGASESYGTSWTVASMIAQTSGVPLKMKIDDYEKNSTEFSNITTLGDILHDNGYNNYLLLGSDANFGGRKAYFTNHHYEISDYYTAIEVGKIEDDYFEWWGYEDIKLFSYAKEWLGEISKKDEPFNLTLLTADTHFTDGYLDSTCENKFDDRYSNSFHCSDSKVNEFINWLKDQDYYEDTVIVIVGDHPTMQDNFYEVDKNYQRTMYNAIIGTDITYVNNKNRIFTTMDMFPTTLASLGVTIEDNRLGLGTNLFSDRKTIAEEIGIEEFNKELKKNSEYYYKYIRG